MIRFTSSLDVGLLALCTSIPAGLWRQYPDIAVGRSLEPDAQVTEVRTVHREGQTFITWRDVATIPAGDEPSADAVIRLKNQAAGRVSYRVYRTTHPIVTVSRLTPVGVSPPLSVWNTDFHGVAANPASKAFRYSIEDGAEPLSNGVGLYVHNPSAPGRAYYAVTAVVDGRENTSISSANATADGVVETVGPGTPILQRVERPKVFYYVNEPELRFYTRWETPPTSNRENQPFDYLVAIPPTRISPAYVGIHMHAWGGNLQDGYGWWFNSERGAILVSTNQIPYDWWTGYHESLGKRALNSPAAWASGVVRPYTQNRVLSFVKWLASTRPIDLSRTFAAGMSMGGAGSIMLAIRRPSEIAWAVSWVGIHRPHMSPTFSSSYEPVYGPMDARVPFEDGTPVWEHFDDATYLLRHPGQDVGFITFSNGKNDHNIGWQQAVDFLRALQATRQPHLFVWGQGGHNERAAMPAGGNERTMPLDIQTNRSLPAFTRSTLDDDPGNGNPDDGAPSGQINRYLEWDPATIVDEPHRWEITVGIAPDAPAEEGRTDVTPRRVQQFKPSPGETIAWTNRTGRTSLQTGEVTVDQHGLVTVPQVQVRTGRTRLSLQRKVPPLLDPDR